MEGYRNLEEQEEGLISTKVQKSTSLKKVIAAVSALAVFGIYQVATSTTAPAPAPALSLQYDLSTNPFNQISTKGLTAYQSSNYKNSMLANKAIDGVRNTKAEPNICAHTLGQKNPWWYVELNSTQFISQVFVLGRSDGSMDRFRTM